MQPHASKDDYERALDGLEFPVSTAAVIRKARDHGGIDTEVIDMLMQLPEASFSSREELIGAIRGLYSAVGVERERMPV